VNDWGLAWARETRLGRRSRWAGGVRTDVRRSHLVEQARRQRFADATLGDWVLIGRSRASEPGAADR
jgi:hypothetical protein